MDSPDGETAHLPRKHLASRRKQVYVLHMGTATKTLKLPFLRFNRTQTDEFAHLQARNTSTANALMAMPKSTCKTLTRKAFVHVKIGTEWATQTLRNVTARAQVQQCHSLALETNTQNWTLH